MNILALPGLPLIFAALFSRNASESTKNIASIYAPFHYLLIREKIALFLVVKSETPSPEDNIFCEVTDSSLPEGIIRG